MEKRLIERIKYWLQILLLPVYGFSFFIPRDKKLWVFGSTFGRRFADNPRYFYLYVVQRNINFSHQTEQDCILDNQISQIRSVWISQNREIVALLQEKGYPVYFKYSLKGIWSCLRGGVYFYDNYPKDISHWLSGGAIKINLWHGIPLKKIQHDNIHDTIRHPKNIVEKIKTFPRRLSDEKPSHYVLSTSEYMASIFKSAFQTKRVIVSGYPRNDAFGNHRLQNILSEKEEYFLSRMQNTKAKYRVLYMPTFRDSEEKFFEVIDLRELNRFLEKNHILLCVKLHCKSKLKQEFDRINSDNILVIDAETDPYIYIEESDLLITDYSSIYFDYMLSGKPIIFFHYDLEEYLQNSRQMYFDYEKYTPGKKAKNWQELMTLLSDMDKLTEQARNENPYEAMMKQFYDGYADRSSERLYNQICKIINIR